MPDTLNITGLSKKLGDFTLPNMELRVEPGCVTGFSGSNGAGKTTSIKMILGLLSPDARSIRLFGQTVDTNEHDPEIRQKIGVVFDSYPFPPAMKSGMTKGVRFAPFIIMFIFLAGASLLGGDGVWQPTFIEYSTFLAAAAWELSSRRASCALSRLACCP